MTSLNGAGGPSPDPELVIDGTRFVVGKLPAMAAFDLMEQIRRELGKVSAQLLPEGTDETRRELGKVSAQLLPKGTDETGTAGRGLIQAALSLEPAFVALVRRKLFEKVSFSNQHAPALQQLAGAEDMAFDGLEPVAVYEVLLRCLAVNFTASLRALVSRFNDVSQATSPPIPSD